MRVYHRTAVMDAILAEGFRDGRDTRSNHGLDVAEPLAGVFVSDRPLDGQEGATGDQLLSVDIEEAAITEHEWIESGKNYREWCVPAEILNANGRVAAVIEPTWVPFGGGSDSEEAAGPTLLGGRFFEHLPQA